VTKPTLNYEPKSRRKRSLLWLLIFAAISYAIGGLLCRGRSYGHMVVVMELVTTVVVGVAAIVAGVNTGCRTKTSGRDRSCSLVGRASPTDDAQTQPTLENAMTAIRRIVRRIVRTSSLLCLLAAASVSAAGPATTQPTQPPRPAKPATMPAAHPRRGEILRIENDTITAQPFTPPRDNGEGSGPQTYRIDANTQIFINTLTEEQTTDNGQHIQTYSTDRGTRDDLQVGLRARIHADGDIATKIDIYTDKPNAK
jgi:hypothetical protein